MKKRIFSFLIVVVIAVAALVSFGVPTIIRNSKIGMEYNAGFDILYEISTDNEELGEDDLAKTAAEGIEKRLDIANVIDPIVSIEGEKYVRVTVSASSQIVADNIRDIIESGSEITFRDTYNNLKATGDEILDEVGATLTEDEGGNPAILLHIKDTEKFAQITEEISNIKEENMNKLVVWLGYEEGDDYANINSDMSVAKKIIYNATVTSKLTQETITVSGSYSTTSAQYTVDLINSGTIDYTLDVVQLSSVQLGQGSETFNKVLIASAVVILVLIVVLCAIYKFGGVVSSITLIFNTFLSVLLFVAFKGIINQQFIAALIVTIGLTIDAIVITHERIKQELYNGKSLERATKEGTKKSTVAIIDANVVALLISLVMYFLGTNVTNFALMLALSCVCNLLVMTVVYKFFLYLTARLNVKPTLFGAKKAYLENKEVYANRKLNNIEPLNFKKKFFIGCGAFATVAIIVMLVLQLVAGSLFNYNNTIRTNSDVTIVTTSEYFTNEEHVIQFFNEDLNVEVNKVKMSEFDDNGLTKYKVYVTTDDSIVDVEGKLVSKLVDAVGENEEHLERYELYINDISPKSTVSSLLTTLYTSGIALLVVGIYLAIRFRYTYAISAVVSILFSLVATALFLGLTRIKVGSDAITAIFAIVVYGLCTLIVIFSRLKEMLGSLNRKYISNEERETALNKAVKSSLPRTILTTVVVTLISVVLLAFASLNTYSFYVTLILGLVFSSISAVMVSSLVWLLFEKRSDTRKRTFKPKKKHTRFKELEETTIIGIND